MERGSKLKAFLEPDTNVCGKGVMLNTACRAISIPQVFLCVCLCVCVKELWLEYLYKNAIILSVVKVGTDKQ